MALEICTEGFIKLKFSPKIVKLSKRKKTFKKTYIKAYETGILLPAGFTV